MPSYFESLRLTCRIDTNCPPSKFHSIFTSALPTPWYSYTPYFSHFHHIPRFCFHRSLVPCWHHLPWPLQLNPIGPPTMSPSLFHSPPPQCHHSWPTMVVRSCFRICPRNHLDTHPVVPLLAQDNSSAIDWHKSHTQISFLQVCYCHTIHPPRTHAF